MEEASTKTKLICQIIEAKFAGIKWMSLLTEGKFLRKQNNNQISSKFLNWKMAFK